VSKFSQTVRAALRYLSGNTQLVPSNRTSPASSTDFSVPGVLAVPPGIQVVENTSAVLARGIALYLLWNRRFPPIKNPSSTNDIVPYWESMDPWYVLYLVWKPGSNTQPEQWQNSLETLQAVAALCDYANQVVQSVVASYNTHGQTVFPVYSVIQVREMAQKETWRSRLLLLRRRAWKVSKKERTLSARRELMQYVLRHLEAFVEEEQADWSSATFSHYDQDAGERGWIIIHPRQAFVAGIGESQSRTLINILQRRDMVNLSEPRPGISIERYEEVLTRIGQWNSTQEMREAGDRLEKLVSSGKKSTDGQVSLNFALAFIGVLLSLAPSVPDVKEHLWVALILLGIASLCFWGFARFEWIIWQILGFLLIVGTILLLYVKFWYSWLQQLFSLFVHIIHC